MIVVLLMFFVLLGAMAYITLGGDPKTSKCKSTQFNDNGTCKSSGEGCTGPDSGLKYKVGKDGTCKAMGCTDSTKLYTKTNGCVLKSGLSNAAECSDDNRYYDTADGICVPKECMDLFQENQGKCTPAPPPPEDPYDPGSSCDEPDIMYGSQCKSPGDPCEPDAKDSKVNYVIDINNAVRPCVASGCVDSTNYTLVGSTCLHRNRGKSCRSTVASPKSGAVYAYDNDGKCVENVCSQYYKVVDERCVLDPSASDCTPANGVKSPFGIYSGTPCTLQACQTGFTKTGTTCVFDKKTTDCTGLPGTIQDRLSKYVYDGSGACVWEKCVDGFSGTEQYRCVAADAKQACTKPNMDPNGVYMKDNKGVCKFWGCSGEYIGREGDCHHPRMNSDCEPTNQNYHAFYYVDRDGSCVPRVCIPGWKNFPACDQFDRTDWACNEDIVDEYKRTFESSGACKPSSCNTMNGWKQDPTKTDLTCISVNTGNPCNTNIVGQKWYIQPDGRCLFSNCDTSNNYVSDPFMICKPRDYGTACKTENGKVFKKNLRGECVWDGYSCDVSNNFVFTAQGTCARVESCQTTAWANVGDCNTSGRGCGTGKQLRRRTLIGSNCTGIPAEQLQDCYLGDCPLQHCLLSEKIKDTECTKTCGGGTYNWHRNVVQQATIGGQSCDRFGPTTGTDTCNDIPCPDVKKDCIMGKYGDWEKTCSRTCGGGRQMRFRPILQYNSGGGTPCEKQRDTQVCNTAKCEGGKKDCETTEWGNWSDCTAQYGIGIKVRSRGITQYDQNDGALCPPLVEVSACEGQTYTFNASEDSFNILRIPLFYPAYNSVDLINRYIPEVYKNPGTAPSVPFQSPEDGVQSFLGVTQNLRSRKFVQYTHDPGSLQRTVEVMMICSPMLKYQRHEQETGRLKTMIQFLGQGSIPGYTPASDKDYVCIRDPATNKWYVLRYAMWSPYPSYESAVGIAEQNAISPETTYTSINDALARVHRTNKHVFWFDGRANPPRTWFPPVVYRENCGTVIFWKQRTSQPENATSDFFCHYDDQYPKVEKPPDVDASGNRAPDWSVVSTGVAPPTPNLLKVQEEIDRNKLDFTLKP